ncbi:MAG: hypothetical protein LBJ14_01795 [Desulfarculales bacterium]|jgi:hypothetical protein|nr:hypothetical protein [Desulfarculales bacterium]
MPLCTNCGQPIRGEICPYCKTPSLQKAKAAEAKGDGLNLYKGFLDENETVIFNHYLRMIQSGLLEVMAMDKLGTDNKMELDDIKSIVKRGLKALQNAQEKARKEAEQQKKKMDRENRKAARTAKKKTPYPSPGRDQAGGKVIPGQWTGLLQGWPRRIILGLLAAVVGTSLIWFASSVPQAPQSSPPLSPAPEETTRERIYLRPNQVACQSRQALQEITRAAQNRESYAQILGSGRCFVSRNDIPLTNLTADGGSVLEGRGPDGEILHFHDFSLRRDITTERAR